MDIRDIADKDKGTSGTNLRRTISLRNISGSPAVWGLAISGYSPESAEGLVKVAISSEHLVIRIAESPAMGLSNFHAGFAREHKGRVSLKATSVTEIIKNPKVRVWRIRSFVRCSLGVTRHGSCRTVWRCGSPGTCMEIEILQQLPAATATPRLLEIYRAVQRDGIAESYNRRAARGRALVNYGRQRGIDILDTLLDAAPVVPTNGGAANHQYRHNVFAAIQKAVGRKFGYEQPSGSQPTIDDAILLFREWWFRESLRI